MVGERQTLARLAARLKQRRQSRLPALVLLSDSLRLPDPLPAAACLPRGAAVILRHYDDPKRPALALALGA
ncbi:MAG: thiamine phosphate synthase, partial [Alphaproteobacteria bacterium]|nr:thiamine phosphate synthase [Alphaproteobacteria bacterium]